MSEMVERVARALFDASQLRLSATLTNEVLYGRSDVTWEMLNSAEVIPEIVESYRKQARAAIEAMREPTESMIESGVPEINSALLTADSVMEVWRAMSDQAMK
jgi:hypothetical protein